MTFWDSQIILDKITVLVHNDSSIVLYDLYNNNVFIIFFMPQESPIDKVKVIGLPI